MSHCPKFDFLLVFPHLHVQNANAISSPLTHGFPSITAFMGLMWALARKTREQGLDLTFSAVGVVCHDHQEKITQDGYVHSFCLTRNPIAKDGSTAAIVEEGRIHLEVSLVLAVQSTRWLHEPDSRDSDIAQVASILASMRLAGGTFLPPARPWQKRYQPYCIDLSGSEEDCQSQFSHHRYRLLPGFALVARDDLLDSRLIQLQANNPEVTRLDAWLSLSRINWRYKPDENQGKSEWVNDRKGLGWIAPIPVGYGALGELQNAGTVWNARDADTPFRFVESLYSVGQWLSPHRLDSATQLLWYADSQTDAGLYRCRNDYRLAADANEPEFDF